MGYNGYVKSMLAVFGAAGGKTKIAGLVPAIFLEVENRETMASRNALRVVNRVATEKSPSGTAVTGAHAPVMCLEAQNKTHAVMACVFIVRVEQKRAPRLNGQALSLPAFRYDFPKSRNERKRSVWSICQ